MIKRFGPLLTAAIILFFAAQCQCAWYLSASEHDYDYFPSANLGLNTLQNGYPGYKDYINLGADLYVQPDTVYRRGGSPFADGFFYRVSLEYFPLLVPDGTYNTNEDILGLTGDLLYTVYRRRNVAAFVGFGIGGYFDWIRVNTPASGSLSTSYFFFGFKPSIGMRIRLSPSIELIPEVRSHFLYTVNNYLANNTAFQVGVCWHIQSGY